MRHTHSNHRSGIMIAALLSSAAIFPAAASANSSYVCSTNNLDRGIEVIQPNYGSAVCKVLYRKPDEGVPDEFLWRSNDDLELCENKAQELVKSLVETGFNCIEGSLDPMQQRLQQASGKGVPESEKITQNAPEQTVTLASAPGESARQSTTVAGGVPYQRVFGLSDTRWHVAGYADATFVVSDFDGETTTDFSSARFNPGFHFQYKDLIMVEAEIEFAVDGDGETETELEYAQADIFLHDNVTLVAGQFLSPVGQFQERLHPTWINRLGVPPAGYGHDGLQPTSETGVMLRGGVPIGQTVATYAIAIGNGPRVSHEGGLDFEAKGDDDNSNKAFSGRLGFLPVPYFEIGGSLLVGDITGADEHGDEHGEEPMDEEPDGLMPTSAEVVLWGVDAAYTRGPWDIRAEYLNGTRDPIATAFEGSVGVEMLPKLELEAWYAQAAYRLSGITDHRILSRFEPVFRYGEYNVKGLDELAEEAAEERINVGLNYWLAPSIVARGVIEWRDFTAREEDEPSSETRYYLQLAYGF